MISLLSKVNPCSKWMGIGCDWLGLVLMGYE